MVDRTTVGGASSSRPSGDRPTDVSTDIARSLGIFVGPIGERRVDTKRVSALLAGADPAWSPDAIHALLTSLDVPIPKPAAQVERHSKPWERPVTQITTKAPMANGPIGVYHLQRNQVSSAVKLVALDEMLDEALRTVPSDAVVVLSGFDVPGLEHSRHARRIAGTTKHDADLPALVGQQLANKVVIVSPAPFSDVLNAGASGGTTVQVEGLQLNEPRAFNPYVDDPGDHTSGKSVVMVETYAEFPALLRAYLSQMDRQWAVMNLLDRFSPDVPEHEPVRAALLEHLGRILDEMDTPKEVVSGLPAMNVEDLKLSIANLMTLARRQTQTPLRVQRMLRFAVRNSAGRTEELDFDTSSLPPELAKRVDRNNLLLAAVATEARATLANRVSNTIEAMVDGVQLLGSAAWGGNYGVHDASDVDLEVMIKNEDLDQFVEQLPDDLENFTRKQAYNLMEAGSGRVFAMLRALLDDELLPGTSKSEQTQDALKTFGRFAKLRQAGLGDYLSYKVNASGVDVSLHVVPTEVYTRAASMDLVANAETKLLHEVRIGERKKVREGASETVDVDHTVYPDKRSFDGSAIDYTCDVRAVVVRDGELVSYKPSQLEAAGVDEEDVYAWVTGTPLTMVEHGRLYHGLFQDKAMWGELTSVRDPALLDAKAALFANLIDRFAHEVDQGMIGSRDASILKLSARLERIPEFTKKGILERLKRDHPASFLKLANALDKIGSKELESYGIKKPDPRSSADGNELAMPSGFTAHCKALASRGLSAVADLTSRLDDVAGTKITDAFGLPDAEIVFLIKPLGMQMGVEQRVRAFIEDNGGTIVDEFKGVADTLRIAEHYKQHSTKPVFGEMVGYYAGEDVCALKVRINSAKIADVRELLGGYKPKPGSFRDELIGQRWKPLYRATGVVDNGLHISDSKSEGARESKVWFGPPPIVSERPATQRAHEFLWEHLSAVDPSLQFAGSQYNGLAIPVKKDDLDYRVLADDVDAAAEQVANIEGVTLRREGVDAKCGERFLLYEYEWEGGKADIAVVPKQHYRSRVSAAVLANFLPDTWKEEVRDTKESWRVHMERAIQEHGHGSPEYKTTKGDYEAAKKRVYLTVKRYFGLSQKSGPVPKIPQIEIDEADLKAQLAQLPLEQRPGVEGALDMLPTDVRGALLGLVEAFDVPEPPAALAGAIDEALEADRTTQDALVERHRAGYAKHVARYEDDKPFFDRTLTEVAEEARGVEVLSALKGERRGISRAVLKGTVDEPNWAQVKDVLRGSVVVKDVHKIGHAIDAVARRYNGHIMIELDKSGQIVKVPKDRFRRPVGGYYDYMLKVDLMDGRQAEVQFLLPEMLVAKLLGKGHEVYERMRATMRLFDDPEHGETAKRYYDQLDVEMRDYYGAVMELSRARHGKTEMPFLDLSTPYVDSLIHNARKDRGLT